MWARAVQLFTKLYGTKEGDMEKTFKIQDYFIISFEKSNVAEH